MSQASTARMERAVRDYLAEHKPRKDQELQHHRESSSMPAAIREAVLPCGRIHAHQRRQGYAKMERLGQQLTPLSRRLRGASSFAQLLTIVAEGSLGIWADPVLTIYDTSVRLGTYLGLEPEVVHLHRGARDGARVVMQGRLGRTVSVGELPAPFAKLTANEIEDCLCIFKDYLRGKHRPARHACACSGAGSCRRIAKVC